MKTINLHNSLPYGSDILQNTLKLQYEVLHSLCSTNTVTVIKARKIRWKWHVAHTGRNE